MKKVIYACFLLVASMSIVSCEKDDPKGKKDKEEQKEEQAVEKTKYVLLDSVKKSINEIKKIIKSPFVFCFLIQYEFFKTNDIINIQGLLYE